MRFKVITDMEVQTSKGSTTLKEGQVIKLSKEEAIPLINEGKITSVRDILTLKYNELVGYLHNHDLTGEEIKEALPGLYQDIQDLIQRLDDAFIIEDITAFKDAFERIRLLYTDALLKGRGNNK